MEKSVMIVGVGGQGTLLASRILGNTVIREGYDTKVSEVHGMSQRGGSVVTYVKFGEKVYSPCIGTGEADVILAFELLEAARALPNLKAGGTVIVNTQEINPMPVITGAAKYPANLGDKLDQAVSVIPVDALKLAREAGSIKAVNVVLMGVYAKKSDIPYEKWVETVKETVPAKFLDVNLKAFDLGYQL